MHAPRVDSCALGGDLHGWRHWGVRATGSTSGPDPPGIPQALTPLEPPVA